MPTDKHVSPDTQMIVAAIRENNGKLDSLTAAVHELALTTSNLNKDVENTAEELRTLKSAYEVTAKQVASQQSTINIVNKMGDAALKWVIPLLLVGSLGAGILNSLTTTTPT